MSEIASMEIVNPMETPRYDEEVRERHSLKQRCIRNGDARYAINTLSDHTRSDAIYNMHRNHNRHFIVHVPTLPHTCHLTQNILCTVGQDLTKASLQQSRNQVIVSDFQP